MPFITYCDTVFVRTSAIMTNSDVIFARTSTIMTNTNAFSDEVSIVEDDMWGVWCGGVSTLNIVK